MSKFEVTFRAVMFSIVRLISNVPNPRDIAWDATVAAWEYFEREKISPTYPYWRLVAYHRAVDMIRKEYYRIEKKMFRYTVPVDIAIYEENLCAEDGVDLTADIQDSLTGCVVEDPTPPPSCEWTWMREPGAVREVLRDISARFKRSEYRAFTECLNDVNFDRTTEEGCREDDRHAQGMTRFRKRAYALLQQGELPRRTHQFLSEFLSRDKCHKRMGSGKRK